MKNIRLSLFTIICFVIGLTAFAFAPLQTSVEQVSASQSIGNVEIVNAPSLQGLNGFVNNVVFVVLKDEEGQLNLPAAQTFVTNADEILSGEGASVQNYYKALSYRNFDVVSTFLSKDGQNVFVSESKYTRDECNPYSATNPEGYNNDGEKNEIETDIIREALSSIAEGLNNNVPNASLLDRNNDGYIDALTICILNIGAYYKPVNTTETILWPHKWGVWSSSYQTLARPSINGKNVNEFTLLTSDKFLADSSNVAGSAVAHELGHVIGFPDLYEIDEDNASQAQNVGSMDLMSVDRLQYMTSYSRLKAGWIQNSQFVEITDCGYVDLKSVSYEEEKILNDESLQKPVLCYYIKDANYPGQWICFEYRDKSTSIFDANLECDSGLLIYRVDTNRTSEHYYFDHNYYLGAPATIYCFRNNDSGYPTLITSGTYGTTENKYQTVASEIGKITFQSYTTTDPETDIDYIPKNSGIKVSNIKINGEGTIRFKVEGPTLEPEPLGNEITADDFADSKVFQLLLTEIGKPASATIYSSDFNQINSLNWSNKGITDLSGLEKLDLSGLSYLNLSNNTITGGLNSIQTMRGLTTLIMCEAGLVDISFVANTSLQYINFMSNNIVDFSPLVGITTLESALMLLNDFNPELAANSTIKTAVLNNSTKYYIGVQNIYSTDYLGDKQIMFSMANLVSNSNINFGFTKDGISIAESLVSGINILQSGTYKVTINIPKGVFNSDNVAMQKIISFKVIKVSLINELKELRKGQVYTQDTASSLSGFVGNDLSLVITTKLPDKTVVTGGAVDTNKPGEYQVIFTISKGENSIDLMKTVLVFDDGIIPLSSEGVEGIDDRNLYSALLEAVNKNPEMIGVNDSGALYVQDFYFFDVDTGYEPITQLSFAKKKIASIKGIEKLNLSKITKINLNSNSISNVSYLFDMEQLQELHIANNIISSITNINKLTSLTKLDLSFNQITDATPLRAIADALSAPKQNLINVNLMFNQLDMTVDKNKWMLGASIPNSNYIPNDKVFIILVQGLNSEDIYFESSKFSYYHTRANEFVDASNNVIKRYTVNNANVAVKWENGTNLITKGGKYTIGVETSKRLYELSYGATFEKVCYIYTYKLKDLQPQNEGDSLLLVNDMPNNILTTETIVLPSENDIELSAIAKVTQPVGAINITVGYDGTIFRNNQAGTYTVQYSITADNKTTNKRTDALIIERVIKVITNSQIRLNLDAEDPDNASGIVDEILFNKIAELASVEPREAVASYGTKYKYLLKYDTYNLKAMDLSGLGIKYLNGLRDFALPKLEFLRLNNNEIESLYYLQNHNNYAPYEKLTLLDLSENNITNGSLVQYIHSNTEGRFFINLILNKMNLSIPDNLIAINASSYNTTSKDRQNKTVLVGLQSLEKEQTIITFGNGVSGAGFYYYNDADTDDKVISAAVQDPATDNRWVFNDAGMHDIKYSCNLHYSNSSIASFDYSAKIRHGKVYIPEDVSEVRAHVSKDNTVEEKQPYIDDTGLVFEGVNKEEFQIITDIPGFSLERIFVEFQQLITVKFMENEEDYNEIFTRKINVVDEEKPVITLLGEPLIIVTKNNESGLINYGIGRDVFVTDNYDEEVSIEVEITDEDGEYYDSLKTTKPGLYTIMFNATDISNNVADTISRQVKVIYWDYSAVDVEQPESKFMTGDIVFSATIMLADGQENLVNPNTVFYWYVDDEYVGSSNVIDDTNQYFRQTEFVYNAQKAGEHKVVMRVNNKDGDLSEENSRAYERTYFVLLDDEVVIGVGIGAGILIIVIITTLIIVLKLSRRREQKYQEYDSKIVRS